MNDFVTDAELIRRIGVPEKIAREAILMLDRNLRSGFPKKERLWGNRRYWPAVKAWFDLTYVGRRLDAEDTARLAEQIQNATREASQRGHRRKIVKPADG